MQRRLLILLAGLVIAGCTNPALTRFRHQYDCPSANHVEDLSSFGYRVRGCGRTAIYVCQGVCVQQMEVSRRTIPVAPRTARRPPPSRIDDGEVGGATALRLRIPQLARIELLYAPAIDPARIIARMPEDLAARCNSMQVFADGTIAPAQPVEPPGRGFAWDREALAIVERGVLVGVAACGQRVDLAGATLTTLREFIARARSLAIAVGAGGQAPPAAASSAERSPIAPAGSGDDTRAWLDAHRDVILGCAGRPTAVVRVEATDGAGSISLQPPLSGGAEEECVRAALGEVPSDARPSSGTIIHAVR